MFNDFLLVLDADGVAVDIHDLGDSDVLSNASHPQDVVKRGGVAVVVEVRQESIDAERRGLDARPEESLSDVVATNVGQARLVLSLPLPPDAVQVGVVEEEQRVSRGKGGVIHLWRATSAQAADKLMSREVTYGATDGIVSASVRGGTQAVVEVHVVVQGQASVDDLLGRLLVLVLLEKAAQAHGLHAVELCIERQSDVSVGPVSDAAVVVESGGTEASCGATVQNAGALQRAFGLFRLLVPVPSLG